MDGILKFAQGLPAVGGLFKGKDGGAATSEFTALAGLYAFLLTLDCPGWVKAATAGVATVVYAYLRTKAKQEPA